jgi:hypothetical protein
MGLLQREADMRTDIVRRVVLASALGLLTATALAGIAGAKPGQTCGGVIPIVCGQGEWCNPRPGKCGVDIQGKCVKVPEVCSAVVRPVCGCDGKTYGNDCERLHAKVQKAHNGRCKKAG